MRVNHPEARVRLRLSQEALDFLSRRRGLVEYLLDDLANGDFEQAREQYGLVVMLERANKRKAHGRK